MRQPAAKLGAGTRKAVWNRPGAFCGAVSALPCVVKVRSGRPPTPSVSPLAVFSTGCKPMIDWYQEETIGRSRTTRCE
jgi:hypothetical protein